MIRLSRMADYAVNILCELSFKQGKMLSAHYLSNQTNISETTVMKLLKQLNKANIISSTRGAKGGYMLKHPADAISILNVIEAIDGPLSVTLCHSDDHDGCDLQSQCSAQSGWHRINQALIMTLKHFTLLHFIDPTFTPMTSTLSWQGEHHEN